MVADSGNEHLSDGVQGCKVNGAEIRRHGLNLCGLLEWVERAGFKEPLALNTVIIAQNAGSVNSCAGLPSWGA